MMFRLSVMKGYTKRSVSQLYSRSFCNLGKEEIPRDLPPNAAKRAHTQGWGPRKEWMGDASVWPLAIITAIAFGFAFYKFYEFDVKSPEIHLSKKERETIDYIENEKNPEEAERWSKRSLIPHGKDQKIMELEKKKND